MIPGFSKILFSASIITIIAQALGVFRQSLIVGIFGFSRGLDIYLTAYAIGAVTVFSLNVITETTLTSVFAKLREEQGGIVLRKYVGWYLLITLILAIGSSLIFLALFPLVSILYGAGFSDQDKELLRSLSYFFAPLVLVSIPYYALSAAVKSLWKFGWAFMAEIILMLGSIFSIYLFHDHVGLIAIGYAVGHFIAALFLLIFLLTGGIGFYRVGHSENWRLVVRSLRHYGALQYASLTSVVERIYFSYLQPGGISGLGVSQQLIMGLNGMLSFRDVYLVPLAESNSREKRLRGLTLMMAILSIIVAAFFFPLTKDVIKVLFQYGKVQVVDVEMVTNIFSFGLIGMVASAVANPLWRFLQMEGSHRIFIIFYTFTFSSTSLLGWLLIICFGFDIYGIVYITLFNSIAGCLFAFYAIRGVCNFFSIRWLLIIIYISIFFIILGLLSSNISSVFFNPGFLRSMVAALFYFPFVVIFLIMLNRHWSRLMT